MLVYTLPSEVDAVFKELIGGLTEAPEYAIVKLPRRREWFGSSHAEDYKVTTDVSLSNPNWLEHMTLFTSGRTSVSTIAIYDVEENPINAKRQLRHYIVLYTIEGRPRSYPHHKKGAPSGF